MTHTQGPWSQYCRGDQVYGGNGKFITVVQSANSINDARLISAAPELLEALKGMMSYVPSGEEHQGLASEAIAAIAKAEGRS